MKKVFGLEEISGKVNELLFSKVENKSEPDKWTWSPANPEKIKNLDKAIAEEKSKVNFITNYKPNKTKQKVVLIFALGNLSYGLVNNLEGKNIKFFFIEYTAFTVQGEVNISIDDNQSRFLKIKDLLLDLNDVSVVVWNPPKYINPLFDFEHIPEENGRNEFIFKKRWVQFLKELPWLLNEDVKWLPGTTLNGSQEWQNKIGEYNLAKNLGLIVPPLIFTNSKTELNKFISKHGNKILIREFSTPPFSFPPVKNNPFSNLKNSPVCFQKYIEKIYELRVIVLFDKVFPCKINSQDSELTKHDWRVHDDANVKWELITIPEELSKKLISLSKKLKLNWCSIDLIYSTNNEYYFLEANRPGAHYWLELFIGLDITKEIVSELIDLEYVEYNNRI
jgi:hypothetical protein